MRLSRSGILSVLLHALALYGLMGADWHGPGPVAERQAKIVWLAAPAGTPPALEDQASPAEPTVGSEDRERTQRTAVHTRPSVPASRSPPAKPATAPLAAASNGAPATDLIEARRRATVAVLEDSARADAHRSFAFPGTIAQQRAFDDSERLRRREQGLQAPTTVFDSPAKGRAGLAEEPAGPFGVHWVTDDCYVFREPTDRFILPGLFVEPTTCTKRLARTDLFVRAKPSYSMEGAERAAVDAETQRREVLRRPTTGTVMLLAK